MKTVVYVAVTLAISAALCRPALAVIEVLTPLGTFIEQSQRIVVAKIEKLDAAKPTAVLAVTETLKGADEKTSLPLQLAGDKPEESTQLLPRLADDLPVVLFISEVGKNRLGLAYTNGTWFQLIGRADGEQIRWKFTHTEPYLRRTFHGTTAELQTVLRDVLTGKAKPPAVDAKEKPGLGPVMEPRTATNKEQEK